MNEKQIYEFYNSYVKPIYSEIEARNNTLPIELLFEIHSAFDHLKRFHLNEMDEESSCEKAQSHLKRGVLDAFKLKLKYFNDNLVKVLKGIDISFIDNGDFIKVFNTKRKIITKIAIEARIKEGNKEPDEAFEKWFEVSNLIDDFETKYLDENKLRWAKIKTFKLIGKEFFLGLITGIISSFLVAWLVYLISSESRTINHIKPINNITNQISNK